MANISISNVEFKLSISDKFQEQLDKGYSPTVVEIDMELNKPNQPVSDARILVRFYETGFLAAVPLINHSWEAHFALSTYITSPKEAFKEIAWGKEGWAILNDVAYNISNPSDAK
jgi:hypothetical protein